jgi:hypothetical protein
LEQALERGQAAAPARRAAAVRAVGQLAAGGAGSLAQAVALLSDCLALYRDVGDQPGTSMALTRLGHALVDLGD